MKDTIESVALEFANNAIEGLATRELGGIPTGMEESVREALDGIVAVPAAELERLREIERCARLLMGALDAHEDASGDVAFDYHEDHAEAIYIAKAALRDATGDK